MTTSQINANNKPSLFLSYGRRDAKSLADRLCMDLEACGYKVWQDVEQISAGSTWTQVIQDGLSSSQIVIALLSSHSVRLSGDPSNPDRLDSICLDEIAFARSRSKPIIPVKVTECDPPLLIYRLDYVDMRRWQDSQDQYKAGFNRLIEGIEAASRGEIRYRSWDRWLRPWDFAAFLNGKRQGFCGREWLFNEIDAWRATNKEQALLITGDPGTGKSAFVAELIYRNPCGQVLAYHCCQSDTKETLQPSRFVRSLAAMIASKLDAYAEQLLGGELDKFLDEEKCAHDPASAFEAAILTPLHYLAAPDEGGRYLLVDALDEAISIEGTGSAITIVDLLASRLGRFPSWLRLVATTRKDRVVLDRLRGLRAREIDAQDPRNLEDIHRYIVTRLQSLNLSEQFGANWIRPPFQVGEILEQMSSGNFLYAVQALDGIKRGIYSIHKLAELPPGLYGLYYDFFQRNFPNEEEFKLVQPILQVVVAAREPLTEEQIARATGIDSDEELPRLLHSLAVYLPESDKHYTFFHKSLADWLTADDRRGELYHLTLRHGHQSLADMCWSEYRFGVQSMSPYALEHILYHLVRVGRWDDFEALITDRIFLIKLKIGNALLPMLVAAAPSAQDATRLLSLPLAYINEGWNIIAEAKYGDANVMFLRGFSIVMDLIKQDLGKLFWFVDFVRHCGNIPGYFQSGASEEAGSIFGYSWMYTTSMKDYIKDHCREAVQLFTENNVNIPDDVARWLDGLQKD